MSVARTFDATRCLLGEGAFWHPVRARFMWFDILSMRLMSREAGQTRIWSFDSFASAMGWVDRDRVIVATATDLRLLDLETGTQEPLCPLEADDPASRSNDGRADPHGGFWCSTMRIGDDGGAGAIYRYFRGQLTRLRDGIAIANAICFAPSGRVAYFTDTPTRQVMRWRLDAEGWPLGEPEPLIDLRPAGVNPDGMVTDAAGNLWLALWGSGRVAVFSSEGRQCGSHPLPAAQSSCPVFGGPGYTTLLVTSAAAELSQPDLTRNAAHGRTFALRGLGPGRPEPRVIL